jgi:hypothetical protein
VTGNDASISSRSGTARDDQFQLNLDGQQMLPARLLVPEREIA